MTPLKFKERWVCFACRKMSRILRQVEDAKPGARPESPLKNCTKCGALLCNIGSFFAPPPKNKLSQWEAASMAASAGYHCHSVGASMRFWEIAGTSRPRLQDVQKRIGQLRMKANKGSRLLTAIGQKGKPRSDW